MSDMKWLQSALSEAAKTSRWLKKEGPGLQAKAAEQMRAKKEAAAGTANTNTNGTGAIPANTPMGQQLAQLKGLLQMLPDSDPRKAGLKAQIDQLTQWAAAAGVGGATPNTATTGGAAANPFAALLGQQGQSAAGNPFAALFAGMNAQGAGSSNPYGYQSSGYGSSFGGAGGFNPTQMFQAFAQIMA